MFDTFVYTKYAVRCLGIATTVVKPTKGCLLVFAAGWTMTNVNVIDLDEFVVGWASQLGKSKGNNSSQNVTHTIDWSRVNVSTEQPSYSSTMTSAPHSVTLFKSRFENKSSGEQEHTFSAQSKYTSSTSVSFRQCFTLDGRTKVDLSLPGHVLDDTSAFGQKLSVTSASTETSEKEQTWNVNTKIAVPAGETITAHQTVQEVTYSSPFRLVICLCACLFALACVCAWVSTCVWVCACVWVYVCMWEIPVFVCMCVRVCVC